jgi:hypothetical protein
MAARCEDLRVSSTSGRSRPTSSWRWPGSEVIRAADDVLPLFDALVSALLGWSFGAGGAEPAQAGGLRAGAAQETLTACACADRGGAHGVLLRPAARARWASAWRQLYREACEWMRSQGVRPVELAASLTGDAAAARARKSQSEVERTMQTLEKLRRLLGDEPQAKVEPGAGHDFAHTVPGALVALQDLKLVEPMMQRLAERSVRQLAMGRPVRRAQVVAPIGQERSREQNQQIGRMLGEEVVSPDDRPAGQR